MTDHDFRVQLLDLLAGINSNLQRLADHVDPPEPSTTPALAEADAAEIIPSTLDAYTLQDRAERFLTQQLGRAPSEDELVHFLDGLEEDVPDPNPPVQSPRGRTPTR